MITDLCPIEGNPPCVGDFFHLDVNAAAAAELGYQAAGLVAATRRRVPCPVDGTIVAVVADSSSQWWMGLWPVDARDAIRTVEYRGAGPGVAATNPWTPIERTAWNSWDISAPDTIARGGSGIVLRLTTAQGQVVESSALIPMAGATVGLGVQVDDLMPPTGGACSWRAPDPFVDALGGIPLAMWSLSGWDYGHLDPARTSGCRPGACVGVTNPDLLT